MTRSVITRIVGLMAAMLSMGASAATISFDNGSGVYTDAGTGVTATVTVTTVRNQDGLFYNSTEDAIGVGDSKTTGAMGYTSGILNGNFSCGLIGCFNEGETITVTFNQQVTIDDIYFRQWENNFLGFGDEVDFTSSGGNLNFNDSDEVIGLLDRFDVDVTTSAFILTPEQDHAETAVYLHSLDFTVSQVPLPAAAYLFGSALVGLLAVGRRRRAV